MHREIIRGVNGLQLRQLRLLIGVSPEKLTAFIATSAKTIRKMEKETWIPETHWYVHALVNLVERRDKLLFNPDLPRGPHVKRWHKFQPKRHTAYGTKRSSIGAPRDCGYWLWLPNHRDHLMAIDAPPTGIGDMWLERVPNELPSPARRRFKLEAFGRLWVDDIDITKT